LFLHFSGLYFIVLYAVIIFLPKKAKFYASSLVALVKSHDSIIRGHASYILNSYHKRAGMLRRCNALFCSLSLSSKMLPLV